MNGSPLFATFAADWNPVGSVFWLAVGAGTIGAFLTSPLSPLPVRLRNRILLVIPVLMALGCFFTRWIHSRSAAFLGYRYFYKFYFAELDTAFAVCVAFGAGFSVAALRANVKPCRLIGVVFGLVFLALIGAVYWYTNPNDPTSFFYREVNP